MNFYEHHLGDYAAATGHLSWDEDMAYTRLIRAYYHNERPIPADPKAACRLVRATTLAQRKSVECVLSEFFVLKADGWHQKRCDSEILSFHQGEPEREAKKVNESLRLQRHREERSALFAVLNANGEHAPWNAPIAELRTLAKRLTQPLPATAPATPATATATATHTHTHTQTPYPEEREESARSVSRLLRASADHDPPKPENPPEGGAGTPAGEVCKAMRQAGMQAVNPGDPRLLALLEQGATKGEFAGLAAEAAGKGKGFAWVLAVLQARREEAGRIALVPKAAPPADDWRDSRGSVIAMGCNLGIGPWDQAAFGMGGESWEAYRRRVLAAANEQRTEA